MLFPVDRPTALGGAAPALEGGAFAADARIEAELFADADSPAAEKQKVAANSPRAKSTH